MSERTMIREGDRAPEGGANCMFRCPEWCAECAEMENERLAAVTSEDVRERVAADADEIWYHWIEGQEDLAIASLRKASDEELARFLDMLADWQRCPKPSDHATHPTDRSKSDDA